MSYIQVKASMDHSGNITAAPTNLAWRLAFAMHVSEVTGEPVGENTEVFFQHGDPSQEFINNDVPARFRDMLSDGWSIKFDVDAWAVGHWYGYDAHVVATSMA